MSTTKTSAQVPKLRFPGFEGELCTHLLDQFAVRGSGHTPSKSHPEYYGGKIKWISLADSKRLDKGYIEETNTSITEAGIKNSSAVLHPAETVILSRDAGVGKSAVMKRSMAVSQHFIAWRPIDQVSSSWFIYYWLQVMKPRFENIAIGNTIKTIGLPYFKKLEIVAPSFPEQQKIAAFLTAVDGRIEQLSRKKALLEATKKGVMQQLFTQTLRFQDDHGHDFPDWEEGRVDTFFVLQRGFDLTKKQSEHGVYPVYSSSGISYYHEQFKVLGPGVVTGRKGSVGPVFYVEGKFWPHDTSLWVCDFCGNSPIFVYHLLVWFDLSRFDEASSVPTLNRNNVHRERISFPSLPEQTKIAGFLSALDGKIGAVGEQMRQTQAWKKGLLQRMFV